MRVLITGASGFAGTYLARACANSGDEVFGASRRGELPAEVGEGVAVDLRDLDAVRRLLAELEPQVVYHLAALSAVGRSWDEPATTVQDNVATAVNMLEALRLDRPGVRVVWAGTCESYGPPSRLPVAEDAPLNPANPYAVSKTAGDLLAAVYVDAHGLDLVRARPFNHAGPGQLPIFIVSSLAQQAAQANVSGESPIRIVTGNPDTRRDFTDVRDVVHAYRLLAEHGRAGQVYNICSGRSISAADQIAVLGELVAPAAVEHVIDQARVRAHEVMDLRGANDRILADTGWHPEIPFRQTMLDTLRWWEHELRQSATGVRN